LFESVQDRPIDGLDQLFGRQGQGEQSHALLAQMCSLPI
jgi:hypothetical protein